MYVVEIAIDTMLICFSWDMEQNEPVEDEGKNGMFLGAGDLKKGMSSAGDKKGEPAEKDDGKGEGDEEKKEDGKEEEGDKDKAEEGDKDEGDKVD